jgi:hypothetical protein
MLCLHDVRSLAFLQVGNTNPSSDLLDEETAFHYMATLIIQLTLCKVSTGEIDADTKFGKGPSQAPRYPRGFVPANLTWTMQCGNCAN